MTEPIEPTADDETTPRGDHRALSPRFIATTLVKGVWIDDGDRAAAWSLLGDWGEELSAEERAAIEARYSDVDVAMLKAFGDI